MRKFRLYAEALIPEANTPFPLTDAMQHRLSTVLRLNTPTEIELFDGRGSWQTLLVTPKKASGPTEEHKQPRKLRKGNLTAHTLTAPQQSPRPLLEASYGLALIKGDRFDWALQKMTELGVAEITPLLCQHGEVTLTGKRLEKKMAQWHSILIAAAEQCHLNWLPSLNTPQTVSDWLQAATTKTDLQWILSPRPVSEQNNSTRDLASHTTDQVEAHKSPKTIAICSGPEGGFSETEIKTALASGFTPITFGPRVLRAETAPMAALSVSQWLLGDFKQGSADFS
jgi:16S rRNA (uracil1498-N3)-methyltransferase